MGNGLTDGFEGAVIGPPDQDYEKARRVFNAMIDRRPALIAQCASAADVKAAFAHARSEGLAVAVRGGGHSVAGACSVDGGLVIDMRRMNAVEVDPEAKTARVQGGATWADFDAATQPHGLVTTGGRVSTTGVAGLTLGGGSGWIERKFGLACDNLLAVDLITPDGREIIASESENAELFWGLHGAGGNFGVATSLTFRLHDLPAFTAALMLWPAERGRGDLAALPRPHRGGRSGGAGRRRRLPDGATRGVRRGTSAWPALCRSDRHLCRTRSAGT